MPPARKRPRLAPPADIEDLAGRKPPPPKHWERVWEGIAAWRAHHAAPVDTVGCHRLATATDPRTRRFQTLVALMLSSQTKDAATAAAVHALTTQLPAGLTVDGVLAATEADIDACIRMVGFHTRKAQYLRRTAAILRDQYGGDVPDTIEGLVALPGVGPKMGYLTLLCAWGKCDGIGVDVHVHRIANRLGWCHTRQPEQTRLALQAWLPKDKWAHINKMLVGFGQVHCLPVRPKCASCPVRDLCPTGLSATRGASTKPGGAAPPAVKDGGNSSSSSLTDLDE